MPFQEILAALQKNPLFRAFNPEELVELSKHANLKHYVRKQQIFGGNETGELFYIILKGDVVIELNSGKFRNLGPGRLFGEISPLTGQERFGSATAADDVALIEFNFKLVADALPGPTSIKLFSVLTRKITNYLTPQESLQLIRAGEGTKVEFKESFSRELRNKIIATMVAFMNTHGGVLFLGVSDDGSVVGLDLRDKTIDNFKLDILNRFKQKTNKGFAPLVSMTDEVIEDRLTLRIDCKPSGQPIFMLEGEQEVYISRTGAQNTFYLKASEYVPVILERFRETDLNPMDA